MTREEALHELYTIFGYGFYNERVDEALNMAIKALEQEGTLQNLTKPNKSDLISRQAAIDAFDGVKVDEKTEYDIGYNDGIDLAVSKLSVLPSAQPFTSEQIQTMQELEAAQVEKAFELGKADRPTGHWIVKKGRLFESDFGICSACGNYLTFSRVNAGLGDANFCPNCGADMRGGEEE